MYKIINSGIINNTELIRIENHNVINYLNKLIGANQELRQGFELYKKTLIFFSNEAIIEYFVKVLGYIVIYNNTVYFQEGISSNFFNKISYVKNGFTLKKLSKMILNNGKFVNYIDPIQKEIDRIGFEHSNSPENQLSFWYPKTANIGFKTPKTIIIHFTPKEIECIKTGKLNQLNQQDVIQRIQNQNRTLNLDGEMFVRLGISSNKFNFSSCHINGIKELFYKLLTILDDMYFKLEWLPNIELVLREYIHTNYTRTTIYNGMPLNTEFRAFYDFDNSVLLGIFNYWDTDTMLDNLHSQQDLITFANEAHKIGIQFYELLPVLEKEINQKLPNAPLTGKWSVDFMYDGNDFVLIDMAHAECSYYYNKIHKS